ncbi:bacteriohemerythrin [bacterium]|nr:bacteriohemerythrin [bacterium]
MAAIIWDDKVLGSGVETVDEQHKKLIAMINELMDATSAGRGKEEIGRMMEFLAQYAVEHFSHEECVMSERKCPAAEANKDAHDKFLEDFTALRERFDSEGPTLAVVMEVQKRVVNWLTQHIKGCDTQLRKCAQQQ